MSVNKKSQVPRSDWKWQIGAVRPKRGGAWKFSKGCPLLAATYHNSALVFRRRRGGGYDAQGVVVR